MPENAGCIVAFDFGLQRIGVAVGNTITNTASPLTTLNNTRDTQLWATIDTLINEWQPNILVIGQPENLNNSSKSLLLTINKFSQELERRYQRPVISVDEGDSSREAAQRLITQRQSGRKQKIKKSEIDQQAAVIILERWLHNT